MYKTEKSTHTGYSWHKTRALCGEEELVISTQDFPSFQEEWVHVGNECFLTRQASTFNLDL